ncbi:MAG TPA: undecaprenyl-diphosphatase UppP [Dehalococcoidia bacterium]|nr:undecaprenyl-diphosphatase UppP [Dehalococcoidia bacterium]
MDDYLRAAVLGLVQALTEFLPISSSGHLVLAGHILGERANSLTFDVGLHVGTLIAVLAYFWREWVAIVFGGLRDILRHGPRIDRWQPHSRLGLWIVLGTLPAVVLGALFDNAIEEHLRQAWLVASLLIVFALVLEVADRAAARRHDLEAVGPANALAIGLAQAVALVPGVSRSGATISAARGLGFDRAVAARFSFLLSAPAVLGAATLKLTDAVRGTEDVSWGPMALGALVSAVAGAAVIHWLLGYLQSHGLRPFVWYRLAAGVAVLAVAAVSTR